MALPFVQAMEKSRRPEEDRVDARRVQDAVERVERGARLDHGEGHGAPVGFGEPRGEIALAVAREGEGRAPGALAERRIFHRGGEAARVGDRIDHRRDDRLGAEIERTARHVEAADRDAHHGMPAGAQHRHDAAQHAVLVMAAMLHVERDGVERLRRHDLHGQRVRHARPRGEDDFSGGQSRGERHGELPAGCLRAFNQKRAAAQTKTAPADGRLVGPAAAQLFLICSMARAISSSIVRRIWCSDWSTPAASRSALHLAEDVLVAGFLEIGRRSLPWHRHPHRRRSCRAFRQPTGRAACCGGRRP